MGCIAGAKLICPSAKGQSYCTVRGMKNPDVLARRSNGLVWGKAPDSAIPLAYSVDGGVTAGKKQKIK